MASHAVPVLLGSPENRDSHEGQRGVHAGGQQASATGHPSALCGRVSRPRFGLPH